MRRGVSKALSVAVEVYRRNRLRIDRLQQLGMLSPQEAKAQRTSGAAEMLAAIEAELQRGRGAPKDRGRVVGGGMLSPARVVPQTKPRVQVRRGGRVKYSDGERIALRVAVETVMAREGVKAGEAIRLILAGEVERGELSPGQAEREHELMRSLYYRTKRDDGRSR